MHKGIADGLRRIVSIARRLYWPIALAFLAYTAYRTSDILPTVLANARADYLVCACLLWLALHLLSPVFTWIVLRDAEADITYWQALRIHVSRLPARYLPGGIWHTVSRVADMHQMGIDRTTLSRLVVLENTLPAGIAAIAGGACITATGTHAIGIPAIVVGAIVLAAVPLILRHRYIRGAKRMTSRRYVLALLSTALFWTIAALAFTCYWSAYPTTAGDIPLVRIAGTYLLAWVAGFASIFAPQGIGVFEAVAGWLLHGALPLAGTALVVAGFRLIILLADLSAFAILQLLLRNRNVSD